MTTRYDVIVIGVGGMGSAAAYHLARRGQRVLGLERFDIPHAMGSSHGMNRIFRRTYYEHPAYVPLLGRAFDLWRDLEAETGHPVLHVTGAVDAGPEASRTFQGSLSSCRQYGLAYEVLDATDLRRRFPAYRLPAGHMAVVQPDGGFVASERAIVAHVQGAQAAGAVIQAREKVLTWAIHAGGVSVETERSRYDAAQLVIAAGPWIAELVPSLRRVAVPERQVLGWFQPRMPDLFRGERFPVFNITVEEGDFYGFPEFGIPGFKFGRHHHFGEATTADGCDREPHPRDEDMLRVFGERYFPDGMGPTMSLKACLFTNTPDENFIIDRHPDHPEVLLLSPCSGHGYKFCSVVGEIAADLLTRGTTPHDLALFRLARPELMP